MPYLDAVNRLERAARAYDDAERGKHPYFASREKA